MSLRRKNKARWATKSRRWGRSPRCKCYLCTDEKYYLNRGIRKHTQEMELEGYTEAWQAEGFRSLGLPTLDYRDYMDVRHALAQHETPEVFLNFMADIDQKSNMLQDRTYTHGLIAIANNSESWIRTSENWHPETINLDEQFAELTRHLFCRYDVPRFMDKAWLDGNPTQQHWFKHIGAGQNIRTAPGLPFVLTKKMAHHFLDAPEDYTIAEALRWGQVHGLDGNINLAEALRETYLVGALNLDTPPGDFWFAEDSFWINVIRFFIRHPMFDFSHVEMVIGYIRDHKYGDPQRDILPVQPNFSMSRRKPESLLDAAHAWRAELRREAQGLRGKKKRERNEIPRSGIGGFSCNADGEDWQIREVLSRPELRREGRIMSHCVGTYWDSCRAGRKSVWTMKTAEKKVATIAVDNSLRRIIEARGKANRSLNPEERSILMNWAGQEGLHPSQYL